MQHQGKKKEKKKKEIFEPQTSTPRQLPKMISTAFRGSVRARPLAAPSLRRCISSNHQIFEGEFQSSPSLNQLTNDTEGDIVLLRRVTDNIKTVLSTPLKSSKQVETHHGCIPHSDIIGRSTRGLVSSSKGTQYCVTFPTIEEYVTKIRRLVTPVRTSPPPPPPTSLNLLTVVPPGSSRSTLSTQPPSSPSSTSTPSPPTPRSKSSKPAQATAH